MTPEETTSPQQNQSTYKSNLGIPAAIIFAAILIAGAIYMSGVKNASQSAQTSGTKEQITPETVIAPVTDKDHIRGNPNAPIAIIEYSDYDCPFCRIFHDTMNKIIADYGAGGKVMWVYRQLPISGLHPNAPKIAEASECVAELGGNDAFWKFGDALNGSRKVEYNPDGSLKSIEPTNMTRLSEFAVTAGVDKNKFENCLNSNKYTEVIKSDVQAGAKAGAKGTPYSILMVGNQQGIINGAQPYETVKQMVDGVIAQMEGKAN